MIKKNKKIFNFSIFAKNSHKNKFKNKNKTKIFI